MNVKAIIHTADEGGFWAEVPSIEGCATQGDTFEELLTNLYKAVEGCLSIEVSPAIPGPSAWVMEIANMRAVSGKRFMRLLERQGWQLKRINGSHHIKSREVCSWAQLQTRS